MVDLLEEVCFEKVAVKCSFVLKSPGVLGQILCNIPKVIVLAWLVLDVVKSQGEALIILAFGHVRVQLLLTLKDVAHAGFVSSAVNQEVRAYQKIIELIT